MLLNSIILLILKLYLFSCNITTRTSKDHKVINFRPMPKNNVFKFIYKCILCVFNL